MGIAVLNAEGELVDAITFYSKERLWGSRVSDISEQFAIWLEDKGYAYLVTNFVTEIVQNVPLRAISACLLVHLPNAEFGGKNCIVPSQWKSWAKKRGALGKEIKGVKALNEVFGKDAGDGIDDNAADAILIGMVWYEKQAS